jgi:N-acetyl-gamma-glutamyl-phosphate/LysW-gamma-L-alpha-aminoadipyl-6-phosphate reductase
LPSEAQVAIVGGSGYAGGELLRLLSFHPGATVRQVTSERFAGKSVGKVHPNLRRVSELTFRPLEALEPCDLLFVSLPHGESSRRIEWLRERAPRLIDLAGDFRLADPARYERWYGRSHPAPGLLGEFVYGIPELHRERMRSAALVSSAGCNATAAILALWPLYKHGLVEPDRTVVEVKVGSSEGGNLAGPASHHPERAGCVRSFMPTHHRHTAEIVQELGCGRPITVHFSATAIDMVRGVLATCHAFLARPLDEKEIWRVYRGEYGEEPFIRLVKEREGHYRYPEPKILAGSNRCDIGFERDPDSGRVVVIAALDNLMKGAAGQAVQAFNLMLGYPETTGLEFPGLHPV